MQERDNLPSVLLADAVLGADAEYVRSASGNLNLMYSGDTLRALTS